MDKTDLLIPLLVIILISNCYAQKLTVINKTKNYIVRVPELEVTKTSSKYSKNRLDPSFYKIEPEHSGNMDLKGTPEWMGWEGGPIHNVKIAIWPISKPTDYPPIDTIELKPYKTNFKEYPVKIEVSKVGEPKGLIYTYYDYEIVIKE